MPYFAYKGRDAQGEVVRGVLEGPDSGGVAGQLFGQGITPVEIVATGAPAEKGGARFRLFREKIPAEDVMLFSRQMYTLLKAGVPILRALTGLQESTRNKSFADIIGEIRTALDRGRELNVALRQHPKVFSPFYISMVQVGEMTGMLEEVFLRLFHHLEFEREMRERVRSALRYPTFVVIAMVIAVTIINLFVIPAFAKVFAGFKAELPFMTRVLIGTSHFFVTFWPLLLAGAVAAVVGFRAYITTPIGRYQWDEIKLRLPIAGPIIRTATLARFSRSFALASRSGVPIVQGLHSVAQVVDNAFIAKRVGQICEGVERGESVLSTAVATGIFTPVVLQMIAVGEETGELDDLMQEVAEMYEHEVDYALKSLSAQIEPILIVGLGVLVLILALGVFLPIWDLGRVAMHR